MYLRLLLLQAEELEDGDTCIAGQVPEEDPVRMCLARQLVSVHARRWQLQAQLQVPACPLHML